MRRRLTVEEYNDHYIDDLERRYTPLVERLEELDPESPPRRPLCCIDCWKRHTLSSIIEQSYRRAFPHLPWDEVWPLQDEVVTA